LDTITTIIFTLEALVKIIANGFLLNGKHSYLRQFSNIFDFIIVISAVSGLVLSESSVA